MVTNRQHSAESDGSVGPATNARNARNHLEQPTRRSTRASKRHQQFTEAQRDHKSASVSSSTPGSVGARELDDLDLDDDPRIANEAASPMPHCHSNTAGDEGACITAILSNTEGLDGAQEQAVSQDDVRTDEPSARNDLGRDTASEPALKKAKTLTKQEKGPAVRRKSRSKWDSPLEMLTNQNSPLGKAELRDLLCMDRAWDVLSEDEKKQVLAEFPSEADIIDAGTDRARPNIASLRNNDNFRHDISRYQENLREGRHDPEWISQAQAAHRKRALGFYDEFLASKFEEDWGMPMPDVGAHGTEHDGSCSGRLSSAKPSESSMPEGNVTVPDRSDFQLPPPPATECSQHDMSNHQAAGAHDQSDQAMAE